MNSVLVFGTFDFIHPGHLYFLKEARKKGEKLIVAIARDEFVIRYKKRNPIKSEQERLQDILKLSFVDEAVLSDSKPGTYSIIKRIKPDIICVGYDQRMLKENLSEWVRKKDLSVRVVSIESFNPGVYKSSFLNRKVIKKNSGYVFTAIDFETTGLDPLTDKVIEIGAVQFTERGVKKKFHKLIDPKVAINHKITELNGISNEMVKGKPVFKEVLPSFLSFIKGSYFIAHNVVFEIGFLMTALSKLKISIQDQFFFDSLTLYRYYFPELGRYNLNYLTQYYKIKTNRQHRALEDSLACSRLFIKLLEKIRKMGLNNLSVNPTEYLLFHYNDRNERFHTLDWQKVLKDMGLTVLAESILGEKPINIKINNNQGIVVPKAVSIFKYSWYLQFKFNDKLLWAPLKDIVLNEY